VRQLLLVDPNRRISLEVRAPPHFHVPQWASPLVRQALLRHPWIVGNTAEEAEEGEEEQQVQPEEQELATVLSWTPTGTEGETDLGANIGGVEKPAEKSSGDTIHLLEMRITLDGALAPAC
jgi:hypothetical protein